MNLPIEIAFRGLDPDDRLKEEIEAQAGKLDRFGDGIASCRVAIERRPPPIRTGAPYEVRVEVRLPPDGDLVVRKHGDGEQTEATAAVTTVREAFRVMERQVRREVERRRYRVKTHEEPLALVKEVFPEEGYGFLRMEDGQEVYFHHNAVLHDDFDRLHPGTAVRVATAMGDKGPQATAVQILDKPGARTSGP